MIHHWLILTLILINAADKKTEKGSRGKGRAVQSWEAPT